MQIPFRAIIVFHAVARAGSLSRAAEELRVTPSAVSQQIQALELHLGTALTSRVGRNITLTEAGERYFQMIGREIEHITDVTQHVRGVRSATTLTVRAAPSVSSKWLLPRLASFVDANPDIELRLDGTNEPTDFGKENVDIEIRHGEGGWPGLFIEGLGKENFFPLCAPALFAPGSLSAEELPAHRLIHSVKSQMQRPRWFAEAGIEPTQRWRRVLFDRSHMAIDAAVDGLGIEARERTAGLARTARRPADLPGQEPAGGRADHAMDRLAPTATCATARRAPSSTGCAASATSGAVKRGRDGD